MAALALRSIRSGTLRDTQGFLTFVANEIGEWLLIQCLHACFFHCCLLGNLQLLTCLLLLADACDSRHSSPLVGMEQPLASTQDPTVAGFATPTMAAEPATMVAGSTTPTMAAKPAALLDGGGTSILCTVGAHFVSLVLF